MRRGFFRFVVVLIMLSVVGVAVMLLWNVIVVPVIGWGALTYLQSLGLLVLCRLLFGGWGSMKQRVKATVGRRADVDSMTREQKMEYIRSCMTTKSDVRE